MNIIIGFDHIFVTYYQQCQKKKAINTRATPPAKTGDDGQQSMT